MKYKRGDTVEVVHPILKDRDECRQVKMFGVVKKRRSGKYWVAVGRHTGTYTESEMEFVK